MFNYSSIMIIKAELQYLYMTIRLKGMLIDDSIQSVPNDLIVFKRIILI